MVGEVQVMGDAADDLRDTEETWEEMKQEHRNGVCLPDCPYCNPGFEPLFGFRVIEEEE